VKKWHDKQHDSDEPTILRGNARAQVLYRNLPDIISDALPEEGVAQEGGADYGNPLALLALKIDRLMRDEAPAGWRGDEAKERIVQNVLYPLTDRNREATLKLFELLKNQPGD